MLLRVNCEKADEHRFIQKFSIKSKVHKALLDFVFVAFVMGFVSVLRSSLMSEVFGAYVVSSFPKSFTGYKSTFDVGLM